MILPVHSPLGQGRPVEKYPPFSGTDWVYFLIREGTHPLLYFQPELIVIINAGGETQSGAYFSLE